MVPVVQPRAGIGRSEKGPIPPLPSGASISLSVFLSLRAQRLGGHGRRLRGPQGGGGWIETRCLGGLSWKDQSRSLYPPLPHGASAGAAPPPGRLGREGGLQGWRWVLGRDFQLHPLLCPPSPLTALVGTEEQEDPGI